VLEDEMATKTNRKKGTHLEPAYRNASLPVETRVRDLMERMTLEDKFRQIVQFDAAACLKDGKFSPALAKKLFKGLGIGTLQDPRLSPRPSAEAVNALQRFLKENTRLGIPGLVTSECLHGHMSQGATIFPQAIGLSSTWEPELVKQMSAVAAREARAVGVAQALSPDLDLAREPRWGRVEETYGEDPYLCTRMGVAYIKGLQGPGPVVDNDHLVSTLKHFAAHGSPESGINLSPVAVGPRELRSLYLQPFKAAVREAGALSVMPAYSEYDGVPCSSNKELLTRILREEWGFQGYTYSDYGAIEMLKSMHRTAATMEEAGRQALEAGLDLEAPWPAGFNENFQNQVRNGEIPLALIDQAVSRVLRVKFLAGLFENPYVDLKKTATVINCGDHRNLARKIAQESIILLKNAGNLLPLDKNIGSIAVIGPNANKAELGDYTLPKKDAVTILEGIKKAVSRKTKIQYAEGCGMTSLSKDGFNEAVRAASESDVAVVVVGESSMKNYGIGWGDQKDTGTTTCGEGFDRTELDLPGVQQQLVEAIAATGTPTVVILVHGRPNSISWIAEQIPAILDAWYPGEEGGTALADVLFGKVNPSGKLPISVPRTVGQVPVFYNYKPSSKGYYHMPGSRENPGRDYVFETPTPLFEFGFGLSYTKFKYANLRVTSTKISPAGTLTVSVDIANTGKREGKEVVQLYINDVVSSVTTPVKVLRGFKKISLKPGRKTTVEFKIGPDDLALINEKMETVVEPGDFDVMIGGLKKTFRVG
jgi:beta-glucosidase